MDLPEDVRRTCLLLAAKGDPPPVLRNCVSLYPAADRLYEAYWEIDRSEWGAPQTAGMRAVLDEYGWTDPFERLAIRRTWRSMYDEERKVREEKRKAAEEAKGEGDVQAPPRSGALKRLWNKAMGWTAGDEDDKE